jgi:hypothetical protein
MGSTSCGSRSLIWDSCKQRAKSFALLNAEIAATT